MLRLRDVGGGPRYLVVDYKTNWLGDVGPAGPEPLTAWHYRPAALAAAMRHAHYPLQALLYAVALHRFLRWRQPAYDPGRHLGGVLYLFVRGMCGPATPVVGGEPCGAPGARRRCWSRTCPRCSTGGRRDRRPGRCPVRRPGDRNAGGVHPGGRADRGRRVRPPRWAGWPR